MFIKSIYIGAFAGKKDMRLAFTDRVNIIEGANESGKSTVAAFIKFIFYGLSGKGKGGEMSQRKRFLPFDSNCAYGSMTVSASGRDYIIERKVTMTGKVAAKDEYKITDAQTGAQVYEGAEPCDVFIGMSESLFEKTAFISQLGGTAVSGNEVASALENLLFSAEESVDSQKAIKEIDSARAVLMHKNSKGGKIYELECERDELTEKLSAAKKSRNEFIEDEKQLSELKTHYEKNERLTAEAKEKADEYERAKALADFDRLAQLKEKLRETEKSLEKASERYGIPTNGEIHGAVRISASLREKESQKNTARSALDVFIMPESAKEDKISADGGEKIIHEKLSKIRNKKLIFAILTVVFAVFGVAAFGLTVVNLLPATVCLVTSGVCLLLAFIFAAASVKSVVKFKSELKKYGVVSEDALTVAAAEIRSKNARYEEAKKHRDALAAIYEKSQAEYNTVLEEASKFCEKYEAEFAGASSLDALADSLSKVKEECSSLIDKKTQLTAEINEWEARLSSYDEKELRQTPPPPEAIEYDIKNLKNSYTFGTASREKLTAKISELEKKLVAADISASNEEEISKRIYEINAELKDLKERLAVLLLAQEMLEKAAENMKNNVSPELASRAGELLSQSTDGKYGKLWVSGQMHVTYSDASSGGTVRDVEYLSGGTQDALYVALRIALCEILSQDKNIPMIFDESFSFIDKKRLQAIYDIISARNGQTLVFSALSRDRETAKDANIVTL